MLTNKFNWRLDNKQNVYDVLLDWWKEHQAFNGKALAFKTLPNRMFVVSNDNKDLYIVSVYISDSDFCQIGFITSNPKAGLKEKHGALAYLYDIISIVMKAEGFDRIISKTNQTGLIKALEQSNFEFTEQFNFYVKNL